MAEAYGNQVQRWRSKVVADVTYSDEWTYTIRTRCYWCSVAWGYSVNANGCAYTGGNSSGTKYFSASAATGETREILVAECSASYSRGYNGYSVSCHANVNVTGGYHNGTSDAYVDVWVPARPYNAHGTPSVRAAKATANYGEAVTISWGKSGTQGNANFDRFELWQGGNRLYSGAGVSLSVVPSSVTGPRGGTATYTLKEIHEWYGTYPSTQASASINVRSGVVSAYDADGNRHTGLVTAYDGDGNPHYVLMSAYDADGTPHSVV